MTFAKTSRLAFTVLVAIVLLSGTNYESTQAGCRHDQPATQQPRPNTRHASSASDPQPSSPARAEWEAKRDWGAFASNTVGDTAVKDSLKQLLASGVDANARDKLGRTALHVAAMLGQTEMARYILSKGAAIDARDRLGRTPLMISASLGGLNLFSGLPAPWFKFWTEPLCSGTGAGNSLPYSVDELMSWHSAAPAYRPLVQLLIDAGADVNVADVEGQTVLDYAGASGLTDIDRMVWKSGRVRDRRQCELMTTQAPAPRGFRLGMTLREVTARFPRYIVPNADSCGRLNLTFNTVDGALRAYAHRPEEFQGVSHISMAFLNERLVYLRVTYDRDTVWRNTGEYLTTLSTSLGLPVSWYKAGDGVTADNAHMIGCDGFKVVAGYYDGSYVELHDTEALQVMLQRKTLEDAKGSREVEEERERRRRTFKP